MKKPLKEFKIVRFIQRTAEGKNKTGEIIHGALDILPLPNQFLGKAVKAILDGQWNETKKQLKEAFSIRNVVAVLLTISYIAGWVTPEDVTNFVDVLNQVLTDLS